LDQPTLFVTAAAAVALSAVLLWIARPAASRPDPLSLWAMGMACSAAGLLLVAVPGAEALRDNVAKTLLLLGIGISWIGAREFARKAAPTWIAVGGALLWIIALRLPPFETSETARLTLSCAIGSLYSILIALAVRHVEKLRARVPTLFLLYAHASLYGLRAVLAATGLDAGYDQLLTTTLLLEAQTHTVGVAFLLLAMTKQRAEHVASQTLAEAQNAAEARKRFLTQLSHEVRTPLNSMLGLAQALRQDPSMRATQRQGAETLEAAGRHLLTILNDALDFARIDAGQVELSIQPFNPAVAAEGCLALIRPAALEKNISLRLSVDPATPLIVAGDSTRFQQIMINLLWNAVKFTPDGGRISLRASDAGGLCIDVSDTGPGVPPARRKALFQEFTPLSDGVGGSGLGLAISARLAQLMGGSLTYHGGPNGHGSIFRLELPWTETQPARPIAQPVRPVRAGRLQLLVVDDVAANRFLLRAMLTAEGHRVTEAANSTEMFSRLDEESFDAILLDVHMPDFDGITVARRIRDLEDPDLAAVPLLAVTGDAAPGTLQACLDAGMSGLVTKPIERTTLITELHRLDLQRHRQMQLN
jgi:signal transduction histidine kinase/ActR/RegA family two-component response regulator